MKPIESRGGGWYVVNGERVRGKANAIQVAHSLNGDRANVLKLAVLSEAVDRLRFLHGYQYGDDRDIYKVGGYPEALTYQHFLGLYNRDGIAKRIVDMAPRVTWRMPAEISEPDKEDGTEFTKAWEDLARRLKVWRHLERADRLARIGRYSVLLLGTGEDDRAMATPLTTVRENGLLFLMAYSERHAQIGSYVEDPTDEHFGLPEFYNIDMGGGTANAKSETLTVHHTRVVHIAEDVLENDVFGRPSLESIFNDLHDLQKVSTSSAEAFWQNVTGILQALIQQPKGDESWRMDPDDMAQLAIDLEDFYHDLRRTFVGEGTELKRLAGEMNDPSAPADLYMTKIAASKGIPKRILFGSETGERASTEDQKTWYGMIAERQQNHAESAILRPLIDRLVGLRVLPAHGSKGYDVVWPPLFEEPEEVIAEANLNRARTAKELAGTLGNPADFVEIDEERNVWLRPTGERGPLSKKELEPPEPVMEPGIPGEPSELDEAA